MELAAAPSIGNHAQNLLVFQKLASDFFPTGWL
jgi:hypothetical protein